MLVVMDSRCQGLYVRNQLGDAVQKTKKDARLKLIVHYKIAS